LSFTGRDVLQEVAVGLGAHRVDDHVSTEPLGELLQVHDDVVVLGEVVGLGVCEAPGLLQPVLQVVDDDHPSRAHEPGRLGCEQAHGPAPKTTTTSPSTMSPSWAPK
jgi:hypothetical protein